jgi:hypothetical protein
MGIPFARLRCALPEELCDGVTAQLVGRKHGLSVAAIERRNTAQLTRRSVARDAGSGKIPGTMLAAAPDGDGPIVPQVTTHLPRGSQALEEGAEPADAVGTAVAQHAAGTALMLAVMSMRCTLPESQLASHYIASAAYFEAARPGAGERFFELLMKFKCLLAGDNVRKSNGWLNRARLWRLILLANDEGWYDPSQGIAFALQSTRGAPPPAGRVRSFFVRLWDKVRVAAEAVAFCFGFETSAEEDLEADDGDKDADEMAEAALREEGTAPADCPLTYSVLAIINTVPRALRSSPVLSQRQARRIWCTALAVAVMDSMEVSWSVNQPGWPGQAPVGNGKPETLMDRSEAWLDEQPLEPAVLAAVRAAAERRAAHWRRVNDARITAMRAAQLRSLSHFGALCERAVGMLLRALCATHTTLSIFIAPYLDSIRRWQSFMALVTTILAVLTVNIWMCALLSRVPCVPSA